MCGIAGFCNWPGTREQQQNNLEKMKQRMLHRGPDAGGSYFTEDGQVGLGHRRLSIVDLSPTGLQPMKSHGGRYVIAYNGEIYNYKQIAGELIEEHKVDQFRGSSDTEVLLEAFEAYGIEKAISKCKGMFAIALYDLKEQVLYLLRDRVGEKPLYYGSGALRHWMDFRIPLTRIFLTFILYTDIFRLHIPYIRESGSWMQGQF